MSFTADIEVIVAENRNGLLVAHPSWIRVKLKEVAEILNGFPFESSSFRKDCGTPLIRIRDVVRGDTETFFVGSYDKSYLVKPGELIVGMDGDFNCAFWQGPPALLNQRVCKLSIKKTSYSAKFLGFVLPGYLAAINAETPSVTVKHLSSRTIADIPIPCPSLPEQHRIVAEIEKQFTRLDAGVAALKRVQAGLKRYRAAVLKAACEGKLVPTEAELAKKEGRPFESGDMLLQRILAERRKKWTGRGKYKEPPVPDAANLQKLPEGWIWVSVEQISTKIVDGVHKKPNYVSSGIPFVTVRNLTAGPGISFEKLHYITSDDHVEFIKRANPEYGDILVSKDGTLGVIRVISTELKFSIFVSVAMVKPVVRVMSKYLGHALSAPQVQAQMVPKGSGLQHIHLEDLREDCLPLPPLAEQTRITAEVERRLSVLEELETVIEANLHRATRLRQSILQKAFTGQL